MSQGPHEAVYEMFWDCKFCGQKKLLGLTHRFCANCGAPQDPQARYFPPDDEKVAVHDHPYVGADLACPACRQPMSRAAKCCTNCGSPIDKGAEVARRGDVVGAPGAPGAQQPPFGPGPFSPLPHAAVATPPKKSNAIWFVALGGVLAVVLGLVLVALLWKREAVLEVKALSWERSIEIEVYDRVTKSAWCDERPAGARELSRRKEQRGTRQVKDGENCQTRKKDRGDGTYKEVRECTPRYRSEPVMADRCDFEVSEWRTARTLRERGAGPADPPRWPVVTLGRTGTCLGCEREGERRETYTATFEDTKSKEEGSCTLDAARWAAMSPGSRWKGKVRVMTGGVDCTDLVRQ